MLQSMCPSSPSACPIPQNATSTISTETPCSPTIGCDPPLLHSPALPVSAGLANRGLLPCIHLQQQRSYSCLTSCNVDCMCFTPPNAYRVRCCIALELLSLSSWCHRVVQYKFANSTMSCDPLLQLGMHPRALQQPPNTKPMKA